MNELIARLIILLNELFAQPMVLLIAVPFITGVVCWCIPKKMRTVAAIIAALTSVYTILLVWPLFRSGSGIYTFNDRLFFRLDGLNGFILLATVTFGLLILVYSFGYMKGKDRQNKYYAYVLWTIGASCGALLASEFILLLVFWGFLGITLYQLTGIAGPAASGAAKKTFIIIGGSDSILILGIALLWVMRHTTHMEGSPVEFSG